MAAPCCRSVRNAGCTTIWPQAATRCGVSVTCRKFAASHGGFEGKWYRDTEIRKSGRTALRAQRIHASFSVSRCLRGEIPPSVEGSVVPPIDPSRAGARHRKGPHTKQAEHSKVPRNLNEQTSHDAPITFSVALCGPARPLWGTLPSRQQAQCGHGGSVKVHACSVCQMRLPCQCGGSGTGLLLRRRPWEAD